ncbi:MAG: hypothetical protein ACPH10_05405 [Litorivicinaceae bacterium]
MLGTIDSKNSLDLEVETRQNPGLASPGPLFKEIYAGLLDVEDPMAWGPVLENATRSFLAHTTDIQTLDQFNTIHQVPEKWGSAFHHRIYVSTIESLKA